MKNQHINRRDFLNIVGITAATTTAALFMVVPPKDQGGSGSKASSPVPTDQMTYRTFPGLGIKCPCWAMVVALADYPFTRRERVT